MISKASGMPMPNADSWNCSAVAAPNREHAVMRDRIANPTPDAWPLSGPHPDVLA